jgi:hypothetical protein
MSNLFHLTTKKGINPIRFPDSYCLNLNQQYWAAMQSTATNPAGTDEANHQHLNFQPVFI